MTYGSVCSGIEAATVAWSGLGWEPAWFSEVDPFCSALLAHHYPTVRNHGDFTTVSADAGPIDLLCGGTPCQAFSVAGLRRGLDDARGNLTLEFVKLAGRLLPRWLVWENVPGVLSIDGGRAFTSFLGGLAELRYGFAYGVFDAQYFGVPQRRRRVFLVGYLGNWRYPAAVLFEPESLFGNPPSRREAGQGIAGTLSGGSGARGWCPDTDRMTFVPERSFAFNAKAGTRIDAESETFIAHALRADGFDASEDGTGRGTPIVPVPILEAGARTGKSTDDPRAGIGIGEPGDPMFTLQRGKQHAVGVGWAVRRLTPRECERLQGFPDDYTLIPCRGKLAADGPRYRAIGNSWAVPVARWIGARIDAIERATA